ncbi:hypothetical protein WDU94_000436 [Cyamophila willieti]
MQNNYNAGPDQNYNNGGFGPGIGQSHQGYNTGGWTNQSRRNASGYTRKENVNSETYYGYRVSKGPLQGQGSVLGAIFPSTNSGGPPSQNSGNNGPPRQNSGNGGTPRPNSYRGQPPSGQDRKFTNKGYDVRNRQSSNKEIRESQPNEPRPGNEPGSAQTSSSCTKENCGECQT